MRLRALVIGSGWGAHAARALAADPRVELRGIVGRGSPRTAGLAGELGVPALRDVTSSLAETRPQLVAIAVHERQNEVLIRACLGAGAHVLCAHPVVPSAEVALALASAARERGLVVATDYTLRLTGPFTTARKVTAKVGGPMRIDIQSPGRVIVIGVDLAIALAGPVARVFASRVYPAGLAARIASGPRAFPPSALLEHAAGCVTSLTPVPHAIHTAVHRVTASCEGGRVDFALPCGGARLVIYRGRGAYLDEELVLPETRDPEAAFGQPMRELVHRFVAAVLGEAPVHASLDEEAEVRRTWAAFTESSRTGAPVALAAHSGG